MENKIVLLVSGGLDSFIAWKYLNHVDCTVLPLFINYHGKYTDKELSVCEELYGEELIIDEDTLNFSDKEYGEKAFIKNRNIYLALVASNYGYNICMAGLKDDNVGDKSPEAFTSITNLLNTVNSTDKFTYNVMSPFWNKEKSEIVEWYVNSGFPEGLLLRTTSCYHPHKHYCGECPSCFRKYCALISNGINIPPFRNKKLAKEYLCKAIFGVYTPKRKKSIKTSCKFIDVK